MHPFAMLKDIATGYQEGGADYLYSLLTSYKEKPPAYRRDGSGKMTPVPEGEVRDEKSVMRCVTVEKAAPGEPDTCVTMSDTMYYNTAFSGSQISMAPPLSDGQVEYTDGTPTTVANYSADVTAFLSWAADPSLEARKSMGWRVMLYLLVTAVLLFFAKRVIWRDVH
jgi:cytochrome c1